MGYIAGFVFVFVLGSMTSVITVSSLPMDYDFECQGLPENFLFWWACGSYGVCRGGSYVQVDCVNGTSYDRVLGDCRDNSAGVNFPCNKQPNCLDYDGAGHRYPELSPDEIENLPACTFYYTCSYGRYLGHQKCNLGTVYDEVQQTCLSPDNVPPPCGTFTGDSRDRVQRPRQGFSLGQDGRAVVPLPVDKDGNVDQGKWPFITNTNGNNNRGYSNNNNNNRRRRPRSQPQIQQFQQSNLGGQGRRTFDPVNAAFVPEEYIRRFPEN